MSYYAGPIAILGIKIIALKAQVDKLDINNWVDVSTSFE